MYGKSNVSFYECKTSNLEAPLRKSQDASLLQISYVWLNIWGTHANIYLNLTQYVDLFGIFFVFSYQLCPLNHKFKDEVMNGSYKIICLIYA